MKQLFSHITVWTVVFLLGFTAVIPVHAVGGKVNIHFEASCVAADGTFTVKAWMESDAVGKTVGGQNISAAEVVLTWPNPPELTNGKLGNDVFPDVIIQNDSQQAGMWSLMFGKVGYYNSETVAAADKKPFAIMEFRIPTGKTIADLTGNISTETTPNLPRIFNDKTVNVYGETIDFPLNSLQPCPGVPAAAQPQQPPQAQPQQPQPAQQPAQQPAGSPPAPALAPGFTPEVAYSTPRPQAPAELDMRASETEVRSAADAAQTEPFMPSPADMQENGQSLMQSVPTAVSHPVITTAAQPIAYRGAADLQQTGPAEDILLIALAGALGWTVLRVRKRWNI